MRRRAFRDNRESTRQIAKHVREARLAFGLTQRDLAGLSNTGVRFIVDVESGKPTIELGKLLDVLVTLGLTLRVVDIQAERILGERASNLLIVAPQNT
jgi:HTH-type transcriptional regulator/antitoxin HipB